MKAVLERKLDFIGYPQYSVDTEGNVWNYGIKYDDHRRQKMIESSKKYPICQYTKDGQFVKEYKSSMEAERITGICNGTISKCCRGIGKTAGGYIWKYKKEND